MRQLRLYTLVILFFSFQSLFPLQRIFRPLQTMVSRRYLPATLKPFENARHLDFGYGSKWGQKSILSTEQLQATKIFVTFRTNAKSQLFELVEAGGIDELFAFWKSISPGTQSFLLTASNERGETAFLRAVMRGDLEVAQFLFISGADRYAVTFAGENAMDLAIACGDESMMKLLVQK
jgi:hypothetical protein